MGTIQVAGFESSFAFDYEASFNVAKGTVNGRLMPFVSYSASGTRNLTESKVLRNTRNPAAPSPGNMAVSGSVVVPVDADAFPLWLVAAFGLPTTTGTGPYVHEFKLGPKMPSFILENAFPGDVTMYKRITGCKLSSLGLSFGGEGELTANLGVEGASESMPTTAYDSTLVDMTALSTKFDKFQVTLKEGGATYADCTELSLDLNFGLDTNQYPIGSQGMRRGLREGICTVKGNLKAMFTDKSLLQKALDNTESSLEITVVNGASSLVFKLPELLYQLKTPTIDGPQGLMVDLGYQAYWSNDAAKSACSVTLTNSTATYSLT